MPTRAERLLMAQKNILDLLDDVLEEANDTLNPTTAELIFLVRGILQSQEARLVEVSPTQRALREPLLRVLRATLRELGAPDEPS